MDVHKEQTLGTSHDNSAIAAEATSASALKDSAVVANKDATDKDDHSKKKKSAKSRTIPATEVQQKPQTTRDSKSNDYDQTVQRLETGLPDPVPPSTVSNKPQRLPDGQLNTLTHADIARRRAEQLLRRRYRWIESCAPKLFVLLPNNYATSTKTEADFDDAYVSSLNWTDFAVHFLCDCGGIPGFENLSCPHWTLKEYPWGHPITNTSERSIIDRFASYMVCILEVFKYGVDLDLDSEDGGNNPNTNGHGDSSSGNNRSRINIPAETDPDLRKRIELAIRYLQSKGARTSDDFLNVAERYTPESLALECVVPVSPPIKANLSTMKSLFFSDNRRAIDDTHPYLTQERDVRWVCLHHYSLMTPQAPWTTALKYSNDTAPSSSEFRACMGAFRAVITTRERAREYYRLGEQLTTICVLRLFLDWDLTQEDEEELRVAVSKFPAVCVRIQVRAGSMYTGIVPGFGHGYSAIIFEALKNTKIEAFVMDQGAKDEPAFYGYDERYDVKRSFSARDALVRFKRSAKKNKMNLRILVTDIDRGILRIRKVFEGLHHFTKLSLIISDIWEYVTITFLKPGMPGYDIEDTDYMSNRPLTFFEKRGNMDSITYNCRVMGDNQFLQSKALTSLSLGFIYSRDRNKVRDVLKNNKRLQKIELENLVQDDPSQIYESFKALLVNHPTLDKIEVKQRHTRSSSDFVWRDVSDPAKMSVMVTMYEGDKVASMFQKYATSLRRINICGISIQDASVLEKVLRPKKGPFKLKSLTIIDAHLVEAAALEDLKKIITRGDIEEVKIFGDAGKIKSDKELETERMDHNNSLVSGAGAGAGHHSMADKGSNHKGRIRLSEKGKQKLEEEAAIKMRDFVMSISAKITGLCIWSNSCHRILDALDKKRPYSPIMPMLSSFSASGMHKRILDYRWLAETLLYKSAVIRKVMNEYTKVRGSSGNSNNSNFSHSIKDLSIGSDAALGSVKDIGIPSPGSIIATAIEICPVQVVPLDDLSLQDFEVQPEDWGFLLSVLDFSRLRTFRLDLVNEVTGEMLDMLADVIPSGAPLESFSISVPGPTAEESMMCQQKIKKKVEGGAAGTSRTGTGAGAGEKDKHVAILVNGFIG
ncbi:hypothetical protein B0O80DRAFT_53764 [Mortierella sp. GBAus27b]|nr:hypothetical protein B0O80DRAFT_53764 [Mortierella sp. GBAus27b]